MFVIDCPHCEFRELVGLRRLRLHNTDAGPMGVLECPAGHALLFDFHLGRTIAVHSPVACSKIEREATVVVGMT